MPIATLGDRLGLHQEPHRDREGQHDRDLDRRLAELPPGEFRVAAPAILMGEEGDGAHHEDGHEHARDHPAEEKRPDRDVRHHAVDHEGQGRRDDRPEGGRGCGDAYGELGRVAVVLHRLDLDRAKPGRVRDRRAGHARKDHGADDVHVREPPLHPADKRNREAIDAARDTGDVHEVAGENEEGHREQREAFDAGDHPLGQNHVRGGAARQEVDQRRDGHRQGDRQAEDQQDQEGANQDQHRSETGPVFGRGVAIRSERRRTRPAARGWNSRAASSRSRPAPI